MDFRLYPDCKCVRGKHNGAIYDLTRNAIYLIPNELSERVDGDTIHLECFSSDKQKEFTDFLLENELGRFDMPSEITSLSDEFISASLISNAIIEIGSEILPLSKIAEELSDMVCETVFLRFLNTFPSDFIIECSKYFMCLSMSSIEIGLLYDESHIKSCIDNIIVNIPLCSRLIVVNAPFDRTDNYMDVPIRYTRKSFSCNTESPFDYSTFANANLRLYVESLHHNNCLNRKVVIDQHGYIKNCPELKEYFGNVNNCSLIDVVNNDNFRKLWNVNKDGDHKCGRCELRYACQHCLFSSKLCTYNTHRI